MQEKLKLTKTVHEIEHAGDLNDIVSIMIDSGAKIINQEPFYDEEYAIITYEIDISREEFDKNYRKNYVTFFGIE